MNPKLFLIGVTLAASVLSPLKTPAPGLPLIEVPPAYAGAPNAPLMIMLTGDGGWAEFVREISQRLAGDGWAVVGFDMRKYLRIARTPEETAEAVAGIVRQYSEKWHRDRIVIGGFSRGADIAPFVLNRLPKETRDRVTLLLMLSPGKQAEFEFHFGDFLRKARPEAQRPVIDEINRLGPQPLLILSGRDDEEALEVKLLSQSGREVRLPGDHHLGRDYPTILGLIRAAAHTRQVPPMRKK